MSEQGGIQRGDEDQRAGEGLGVSGTLGGDVPDASDGAGAGAGGGAGPELISRREWARRRGWAPSYAVKLCQQGVVSVIAACGCGEPVTSKQGVCPACGSSTAGVDFGRGRIDPALAEQELERYRDPAKDYTRERWAAHRGQGPGTAPGVQAALDTSPRGAGDERAAPAGQPPAGGTAPGAGGQIMSYADAKTQREYHQAQLAQIEYLERVGRLVSVEAVERAAFREGRVVRDSLMAIPDRLSAMLAAESDPARVHELLSAEIRQVLHELSSGSDTTGTTGTTEGSAATG